MKSNLLFYRRLLVICGVVLVIAALVLALGVIQPIKADVSRGATQERAVVAFWVNIIVNLLSAAVLFSIAKRSKGRSWISTSILVLAGFIVLILGLALADAASAYQNHDPAMQTASILLLICAAADFIAGIMIATTALLITRRLKQA